MLSQAVGRHPVRAVGLLLFKLFLPALSVLVSGCLPDASYSQDEARDLQRARDAIRVGNHEAAASYYERALERNPGAAMVHLNYASLCESHLNDFAEAVYHYKRYLRLRPNDPRAEDIRQRVTNCTERLATSVPLVIRSETIARELEAARQENTKLRQQVSLLLSQSSYWSNEVRRLVSRDSGGAPREESPGGGTGSRGSSSGTGRTSTAFRGSATGSSTPLPTRAGGGEVRAHKVRPGDTLMRISREYGVTLDALRRANPGINERRLLPGSRIRIPE